MMVTSFRVVLDACVLAPITLCDTLLSLADRRLYVPTWSSQILDEMERTVARLLTKNGMSPARAGDLARHRREQMILAFPEASIEGYEALIPTMTNHEKDRHVLAAAIRARADVIVTANIVDFPETATAPYDVSIKKPDDFLIDLLGFDAPLVLSSIRDMTAQKTRPPMTDLEMLKRLAKSAPNFAAATLLMLES